MDKVNHPAHYLDEKFLCKVCNHIIECIDIAQHFSFSLGNVIKYIWRADKKGAHVEDLKKAHWYLTQAIDALEKKSAS